MPITDPKKRLAYFRKYRVVNRKAIQTKRQQWDSNNSDRIVGYTKTQRAKPDHAVKRAARKVAEKRRSANAVCQNCGKSPRGRDGRSMVQAHHTNYGKPGSVKYLCASCHARLRMK